MERTIAIRDTFKALTQITVNYSITKDLKVFTI